MISSSSQKNLLYAGHIAAAAASGITGFSHQTASVLEFYGDRHIRGCLFSFFAFFYYFFMAILLLLLSRLGAKEDMVIIIMFFFSHSPAKHLRLSQDTTSLLSNMIHGGGRAQTKPGWFIHPPPHPPLLLPSSCR